MRQQLIETAQKAVATLDGEEHEKALWGAAKEAKKLQSKYGSLARRDATLPC